MPVVLTQGETVDMNEEDGGGWRIAAVTDEEAAACNQEEGVSADRPL